MGDLIKYLQCALTKTTDVIYTTCLTSLQFVGQPDNLAFVAAVFNNEASSWTDILPLDPFLDQHGKTICRRKMNISLNSDTRIIIAAIFIPRRRTTSRSLFAPSKTVLFEMQNDETSQIHTALHHPCRNSASLSFFF